MTALAYIALVCVLAVTAGTWVRARVERAIRDAADMAWAEESVAWLRDAAGSAATGSADLAQATAVMAADLEAAQARHPAGRDYTDGDFVWLWDHGVMPS